MNVYLSLTVLIATALLQSTIFPHIALLGVHPDLLLSVVVAWSLLRGASEGMLWALIGGIILDLFSGAPFGVHALSLLAVSFLSSLGQHSMFRVDLFLPILIIPLSSLLYNGLLLALLGILGWPADWGDGFTQVILPSALVNALSMPVVYLLMRTLHRHTGREEITW